MKKRFLAVLPMMLLLSYTAFAQLEKGTILLGGGVGFGSSSSSSEAGAFYAEMKNSNFNFSPDAGFFFKDNWVIGISLPLTWSTVTSRSLSSPGATELSSESKNSSWGVAPFVRGYFPFGEKISAFGQVQVGYSQTSSTVIPNGNDDAASGKDVNGVTAVASLGLSYFPKTWLGINLSVSPLSYTSTSWEDFGYAENPEGDSSNFSFGIDTSAVTLGVNFFLAKK
ncbi:outer membrane beta-barrel protein [Algoriphagus sp. H41]|uniref:Outer membrane beta-barrel protein n=1 Tax=Algoriphagus oliviformis TaxID=2811231 RepID=A0ABS3C066_9BACT|nr:outer membrane beta-barrel protein [Algoriphagus oliviformis]MBN7810026.1 outer membrane beta-barrel protein [Algoriphagus oliviformis]